MTGEHELTIVKHELVAADGMSSLYAGGAVRDLPEVPAITKFVSVTLDRFPHKMIPYTPVQLENSVNQGRTAVILGPKQPGSELRQLQAFTQFWPYEHETGDRFKEDFEPGYEHLAVAQAVEIGTWLGPKVLTEEKPTVNIAGQGRTVFQAGIDVAAHVYPGLPILAIVEKNNDGAADVLKKMGGVFVGSKISGRLSNGEAREVKFFGMKNIVKK